MEPHPEDSEPPFRDVSVEDSENQNHPTAAALELEESQDSAWTPQSASTPTFDASQPEISIEEVEDVELPYVLTKTKPKHTWCAVKELASRYSF